MVGLLTLTSNPGPSLLLQLVECILVAVLRHLIQLVSRKDFLPNALVITADGLVFWVINASNPGVMLLQPYLGRRASLAHG